MCSLYTSMWFTRTLNDQRPRHHGATQVFLRGGVLALALMFVMRVQPAFATTISDPWVPNGSRVGELNLYQVYNQIFGTNYANSMTLPQMAPDEVFHLLGSAALVTAEARYARLGENFGYYQPTSGGPITHTNLFHVVDPNFGYPLAGFSTVLSAAGDFGFYDLAGGQYWYSQSALNPGGEDHMVALSTPNPNTYLLAFEDLPFGLSDRDYNDMVVEVMLNPGRNTHGRGGIVPEPASMSLLGIGIAGVVLQRLRGRKVSSK